MPALIEFEAGLHQKCAAGCDVDLVVGDHLLDHSEITEFRAEAFSFGNSGHGDVVAAARCTEPAHHVRHAGGTETNLRVGETLIDLTENGLVGYEEILERDLAVPADHRLVEGVDVSTHYQAGSVRRRQEHGRSAALPGLAGVLTEREKEILTFLRTTMTADEIAAHLGIAYPTVKTHIRSIYRKLGVTKRRAAVQAADNLDRGVGGNSAAEAANRQIQGL